MSRPCICESPRWALWIWVKCDWLAAVIFSELHRISLIVREIWTYNKSDTCDSAFPVTIMMQRETENVNQNNWLCVRRDHQSRSLELSRCCMICHPRKKKKTAEIQRCKQYLRFCHTFWLVTILSFTKYMVNSFSTSIEDRDGSRYFCKVSTQWLRTLMTALWSHEDIVGNKGSEVAYWLKTWWSELDGKWLEAAELWGLCCYKLVFGMTLLQTLCHSGDYPRKRYCSFPRLSLSRWFVWQIYDSRSMDCFANIKKVSVARELWLWGYENIHDCDAHKAICLVSRLMLICHLW